MFATLFSLPLFLALIHSALAQSGFTIDTPNFVQCQPTQITWTDTGNPPYDLLIVPAQDVCGNALEDLGNQTSIAMTFTVNLAAGTQVVLSLEDAVGNEAWSGTITVGGSNDTSCLTSTSPSSTPSASTPAVSGTGLTVPSSGGVATRTTTTSSATSSTFAPVGAAGAGLVPVSGALSTRPLSAVTLLGSAVLAVVAFTL